MASNIEKNKFKKKLVNNYRLVISSEDTWEEKFSLRLNRLNVFVSIALLAIFLIVITTIIIAFTPLKEYIPGYESRDLRKNAQNLIFKTDSLEKIIDRNQVYIDNLARILSGEIDSSQVEESASHIKVDSSSSNDFLNTNFDNSPEDSIFRAEIEMEDRYNLFGKTKKTDFVLLPPVIGKISQKFDLKNKHYAVDIAVSESTPIKAVADGTVIFSEWTPTTGNVIIIEHENNLISVYKHCSNATKTQGDFVDSGEVVAISGSTGELSTGPHLHFELWYKGFPVDPSNYIDFES